MPLHRSSKFYWCQAPEAPVLTRPCNICLFEFLLQVTQLKSEDSFSLFQTYFDVSLCRQNTIVSISPLATLVIWKIVKVNVSQTQISWQKITPLSPFHIRKLSWILLFEASLTSGHGVHSRPKATKSRLNRWRSNKNKSPPFIIFYDFTTYILHILAQLLGFLIDCFIFLGSIWNKRLPSKNLMTNYYCLDNFRHQWTVKSFVFLDSFYCQSPEKLLFHISGGLKSIYFVVKE